MDNRDPAQKLSAILGCVLAQPGTSPRTVFAEVQDGEVRHISRVEAGTQGLRCLGCKLDLIAKPGHGGRVPHFAHKSSAECRNAGETDAHLMAKEAVEEAGGLMLPAFEVRVGGRTRTPLPPSWFEFERVELEKPVEGFRPDVIGYGRHSETDEVRRLLIEVFVTNRVGDQKLQRIVSAGESAIEIDLSKVDRDLNGPEFIDQILRAAPRRWLFHRAEDRFRRHAHQQEAREVARKERQKSFAIAKEAEREEDRQRARERPPAKTTASDLQWSTEARHKWELLDMGDLFSRPADDGIFDVDPVVWRAWVLSVLAPWRSERYRLPGGDGLECLAAQLGRGMRERGWVKGPFSGELRRFVGKRYQPWDPVAEEIERFLRHGLRDYGFGKGHSGERLSLISVAQVVRASWQGRQRWGRDMLDLRARIAAHGIEVWVGGVRLDDSSSIDEAIMAHGPFSGFNPLVLADMGREIETGVPRFETPKEATDYASQGIELRLPGDTAEGCTQRALEHVQGRHVASWQRELDSWGRGEAVRLLSVFQELVDRGLLPLSEVRATGMDFLLDEAALRSRICCPLPEDERDPLHAAREKGRKITSRLEMFAEQLEFLGDLASLCESPDWREIVLREGVRAALAKDRREGFVRALRCEMRPVLRKSMTDLSRVSGRWGYGEDFPQHALLSRPTWSEARLVDLVFAGELQPLRRAMNEIVTRRQPPTWIVADRAREIPQDQGLHEEAERPAGQGPRRTPH